MLTTSVEQSEPAIKKPLDQLKHHLFNKIHSNNLIYNTCWEDPKVDRKLLEIRPESKIVMITSAGDNALDYLLDQPASIDSIDVNYRQNALLDLKLALYKNADYELLIKMFRDGYYLDVNQDYHKHLRSHLKAQSAGFWDKKIKYFNKSNRHKTFYFHGTSGRFAWLFKKYLDSKANVSKVLGELLDSHSLENQINLYEKVEDEILTNFVLWLMNRQLTMSLLGVPQAQKKLIEEKYEGGIAEYIKDNLRRIFTQIPISENYFWHLYIKGYYSESNKPEYLKEENFEPICNHLDRVTFHTTTITQFLKENPGSYSHFVLLDHQDWLANHNMAALEEEWEEILKNSESGTRILLRSASNKIDFFPEIVLRKVSFVEKLGQLSQNEDRVGTYGSTYLGIVN